MNYSDKLTAEITWRFLPLQKRFQTSVSKVSNNKTANCTTAASFYLISNQTITQLQWHTVQCTQYDWKPTAYSSSRTTLRSVERMACISRNATVMPRMAKLLNIHLLMCRDFSWICDTINIEFRHTARGSIGIYGSGSALNSKSPNLKP